jgi:WD40 repeat protein
VPAALHSLLRDLVLAVRDLAGPAWLDASGDDPDVTAFTALEATASAGYDGRVRLWDPADPGADPVELGRHRRGVGAVAVLPDGRLASAGGDGRVRLWDVQSGPARSLLACSTFALSTSPSPSGACLFIGHAWGGISNWEVRAAAPNTPGARPHAG